MMLEMCFHHPSPHCFVAFLIIMHLLCYKCKGDTKLTCSHSLHIVYNQTSCYWARVRSSSGYAIQLWTSGEVNIRFYGPDHLYLPRPHFKKNVYLYEINVLRISVSDVMFIYIFYTSKSSIQYLGCQYHKLSFLC